MQHIITQGYMQLSTELVHPRIATNCAAVVCFAVQSNPCSDSQGRLVWPMHAAGFVSVMYGNPRAA
jgi:hypothetical protein